MLPSQDLSGVVVNLSYMPVTNTVPVENTWLYQEFVLPTNHGRGSEASEVRHPALSGFSLCLDTSDYEDAADLRLEFSLQRQLFGAGWVIQSTGAVEGALEVGPTTWLDAYYDEPVEVTSETVGSRWRIAFRRTDDALGLDSFVSVPNPLSNARATDVDGLPLTFGLEPYSHLFRVYALSADEGTDFLGNSFRSVVVTQGVSNVTTGEGSDDDTFWYSKPNPSKFAVEALYFDQSQDDQPVVIDSVIVDPITPGPYFHVYYSSEGDPATAPEEWDDKLWVRVPQTYRLTKRERFVFPEPIAARYVKIEFTHLQPLYYRPGDFAQPVTYRKHPKWVLDYFLLRFGTDEIGPTTRVGVVWDTLDLAYNYYLDDLRQEPDQPVETNPAHRDDVLSFLRTRDDLSDQVDPETLDKIDLSLRPFASNPTIRAKFDFLLGSIVSQQSQENPDYPVEALTITSNQTTDVSNLRRERIVFEETYPVMFFYLTCRHQYRELQADFSHDRAYFVGVREVAFTRERYTAAHDTPLYIEPTSDDVSIENNDFEQEANHWVVYTE